jgi:RNA polymerase sigma-70 factor, ECF subfamily
VVTADWSEEFVQSTQPFRRELLAHCYRMLGSADDAEDLVQDTYLRAWRSYSAFEGRSSLRTWLYRIATNTCLSALEQRQRRALPSGLCGPTEDPDALPVEAEPDVAWLEPIPDTLVTPEAEDPATIVMARHSNRNGDRTHQALGVAVLTATATGVTSITVFPGGPGLVAGFGLPEVC